LGIRSARGSERAARASVRLWRPTSRTNSRIEIPRNSTTTNTSIKRGRINSLIMKCMMKIIMLRNLKRKMVMIITIIRNMTLSFPESIRKTINLIKIIIKIKRNNLKERRIKGTLTSLMRRRARLIIMIKKEKKKHSK
jgi:hypothetical protein